MAKRGYPAGRKKVAAKIRKVKRDDPGLTNKQAVGKAIGTLRTEKRKRRKR